jgi:RNA chaperone Hfq
MAESLAALDSEQRSFVEDWARDVGNTFENSGPASAADLISSVRDAGVQVTMFLVNGVMLQGRVAAYDLFCMLLEREGYVQLAYKHAVSTIQPAGHVDLSGEWEGEAS